MANAIYFFVPFQVQPKQADRSRIAQNAHGDNYIAHYPSAKVKENTRNLAALIEPHRPHELFRGPLRVEITICYAWRKAETNKHRLLAALPKDTKPDADNLSKGITDVLESIGFFANDAQIAELHVRKCWTAKPGFYLRIDEIPFNAWDTWIFTDSAVMNMVTADD